MKMSAKSFLTEKCRGCGTSFVSPDDAQSIVLLDLWPPQAVIKFKNSPSEPDDLAPLMLIMCANCKLVQLSHSVEQDRMFRDYHYLSGMNASMRASLLDVVKHAESVVDLQPCDFVMDIGSNDGTLLRCYRTFVDKLGFEPARNITMPFGIKTINDYFSDEKAMEYTNPKPKVITAIAMFYDLEDPNKFCADVKKILHEDGVFIVQMNYLGTMIENLTLDNISHEHLCYYSFASLNRILEANGLVVQSVTFNDVNGGSMRVVCGHKHALVKHVTTLKETYLSDVSTYVEFARRIKMIRAELRAYVLTEKAAGKTIWGYGASTRGNTLLQWLGFDSKIIEKIADRNPLKHGKFTTGGSIPICSEEEMRKAQPDNLLVLPYHFRAEFIKRERPYLNKGGKMIFPLPKFEIIDHHLDII
jgi:NDP-4-keto-2,6-dideoxyhexose 3-C-methyltransferase